MSRRERKPRDARIWRTSSAMKLNRLMTFSGVPVNLARRRSSWLHTPTGQVLEWHCRTMMQPMAIRLAVPMPNSSAPSMAAMTMSRPVRMPPSARRVTWWRRLFRVSTWLASDRPISQGPPACLMELCGEAPVPPTWPATRITSALALATPAAMAPIPLAETSFTQTRASGLICFRS